MQSMPSQNIIDESAPTFESTGRGIAYNQRQSMASQNINDESCPTFASSGSGCGATYRQSMLSQNIIEESAPTFESTGRGNANRQMQSMPSQNIIDESAPTFESTGRGTACNQKQSMPTQNINDESCPTFASSGSGCGATYRQSMLSQNIIDESAPTFESTGRGIAYNQRQSMPSQNINDESCPTFASSGSGCGATYRQSMPSQNVIDESAPTFESTDHGNANRQMQSMPSQNIIDESAPTFESTGRGTACNQRQSMPTQNINDESCPTFASSGSGCGTIYRQSMLSQNIIDESAPTFESTGRGIAYNQRQSMPSQNINDESCPTFASSGSGCGATYRQSMPSQNIIDESAPTFESTDHGNANRQMHSMPSQNIIDESAPTFESTGRGTACNQRQSMSTQNINDESCPTFASSGSGCGATYRQSMLSQNIIDESAPTFESTGRGIAYNQRQSMPSQNINDESCPTFASSGSGCGTTYRQPMPSQNIIDESAPTFESTGRGTAYNQRQSMASQNINDESCPTFASSGSGCGATYRQSMPSQNINHESEPSFENTGRGTKHSQIQAVPSTNMMQTMTTASLYDASENTFKRTGLGSVYNQRQSVPTTTQKQSMTESFQIKFMPTESRCDESCSTVASSGGPGTSQRESLPAHFQRESMPSQIIWKESVPALPRTGAATRYSQRQSMVSNSQRQAMPVSFQRQSIPSQNINDVSAPTFDATVSEATYSQRPSQNIGGNSVTFLGASGQRHECLDDETMPSFEQTPKFPQANSTRRDGYVSELNVCSSTCREMTVANIVPSTCDSKLSEIRQTMATEPEDIRARQNISDQIALPIATTTRATSTEEFVESRISFQNGGLKANENIEDEWMPEYDEVGGVIRRRTSRGQQVAMPTNNIPTRRYTTDECLADETMPSQNICDESEPSILRESSFKDETMPSFGEVSSFSRRPTTMSRATLLNDAGANSIMRGNHLPSRNISDESEPSVMREGVRRLTSMPRETLLSGLRDGFYTPSLPVNESQRETRQPSQGAGNTVMDAYPTGHRGLEKSERIEDETMPSFGDNFNNERGAHRVTEEMSMPSQEVSAAAPISECTALIRECMENLRSQTAPSSISDCIKQDNDRNSVCQAREHREIQMTNEGLENEKIPSMLCVSDQRHVTAYGHTEQLGRAVSQRDMPQADIPYPAGMFGNLTEPAHATDNDGERSTDDQLEKVSMSTFNNLSLTPHHQLQMPKTCLDIATETPLQRRCHSLEYSLLENDSESDFFTCNNSQDLGQEEIGEHCGICEKVSLDPHFQSMDVGQLGQTTTTSMSIASVPVPRCQNSFAAPPNASSPTNLLQPPAYHSTGTSTQNSCSVEQRDFSPSRPGLCCFPPGANQNSYTAVQDNRNSNQVVWKQPHREGSDVSAETFCTCPPETKTHFDSELESETQCINDCAAKSSSLDKGEAGSYHKDNKAVEELDAARTSSPDKGAAAVYPNAYNAVQKSGVHICGCSSESEDDFNARSSRPHGGAPGPYYNAMLDIGLYDLIGWQQAHKHGGNTCAFPTEPEIARLSLSLGGTPEAYHNAVQEPDLIAFQQTHNNDANTYAFSLQSERNNDYRSARLSRSSTSSRSFRSSSPHVQDPCTNRPPCWVYPSPIRVLFDGLVRLGESL
ncbi:uncharacterized protein LOC121404640 isoform X4 [Drosophila obscura]|nr:uncharacterized protein LOC121404640 isoform X4 [Drosophila obscura]